MKRACAEKPCPTCPWRKDADPTGANIPGFSLAMMQGLASTVPPRGSDEDGLYGVMACHHSPNDNRYACAGYIARHGWQNINVRLMVAHKQIDLRKVIARSEGIELYETFWEMLDATEAALQTPTTDKP